MSTFLALILSLLAIVLIFIVLRLISQSTTCFFQSTSIGLIRMRRYGHSTWQEPIQATMLFLCRIDQFIRPNYWVENDIATIRRENPELVDDLDRLDVLSRRGALVVWEDQGLFVGLSDTFVSCDTEALLRGLSILTELSLKGCTVRYAFITEIASRKGIRLIDLNRAVISGGEIQLLRANNPSIVLL